MSEKTICKIPVTARYRIIDGEPVMISAEWGYVPALELAKVLFKDLRNADLNRATEEVQAGGR